MLPQVLTFLDRNPAVQIDVQLSDRPVDLIADRLDFAMRITSAPPLQTSARRITPIGWRLVASRPYLRSHGVPQKPGDLRDHRVLLPSAYRGRGSFVFSKGETRETVRFDATLSVNWTDSIARLVLADAGIALLPDYLPATDVEREKVAEVLPRWRLEGGPADELVAMFLPGGRLRVAARALLDFLTPSARVPARGHRKLRANEV